MRAFDFDCSVDSPRTSKLDRKPIESEYTLESWLHSNPSVLLNEPLFLFGRQTGLDTGIPDLLALDQWANVVVFELKKGESGSGSASEATIQSQPQNYAQSLSAFDYDALNEVYQEYRIQVQQGEWNIDKSMAAEDTLKEGFENTVGAVPDRADFNTHQRMVIVAEEITRRTENNAKYLLEQGLNVQCIEMQWFSAPEDVDVSPNTEYSVLATSAVVDYPPSRVQPDDQAVDYSDLILAVRDRVFPRIKEKMHFNHPKDMASRTTNREMQIRSEHPEHPSSVQYIVQPRIQEEAKINIKLNIRGADDQEQEAICSVLSAHVGELDGFEFRDYLIGAVQKEFSVDGYNYDHGVIETIVDDVASELTELTEAYHPKLVNTVPPQNSS
jgi:RecB family endonuclease NucS